MQSSFKLNQLSLPLGLSFPEEVQKPVLDARDREIYALRQQLQTLKAMYKNVILQKTLQTNRHKLSPENEYTKQRIEKLMEYLEKKDIQIRCLQQEINKSQASALEEIHKERLATQKGHEEVKALHKQMRILKEKLIDNQTNKIGK
jgi:hypothetical protein